MIKGSLLSLRFVHTGESSDIFCDASFVFNSGSVSVLTGASGAGKTTLLRCIAGLENRYAGHILIDDTDVRTCTPAQRAALVGFVFQSYNLFPHLSVIENCVQPLVVVQKKSRALAQQKAKAVLEHLGIAQLANRKPTELSGGQQQRAAIARALCLEPRVLLLDEPSSALDPENTKNLATLLRSLAADGVAVVLSSQDELLTRLVADSVFVVADGKVSAGYFRTFEKNFSA